MSRCPVCGAKTINGTCDPYCTKARNLGVSREAIIQAEIESMPWPDARNMADSFEPSSHQQRYEP